MDLVAGYWDGDKALIEMAPEAERRSGLDWADQQLGRVRNVMRIRATFHNLRIPHSLAGSAGLSPVAGSTGKRSGVRIDLTLGLVADVRPNSSSPQLGRRNIHQDWVLGLGILENRELEASSRLLLADNTMASIRPDESPPTPPSHQQGALESSACESNHIEA